MDIHIHTSNSEMKLNPVSKFILQFSSTACLLLCISFALLTTFSLHFSPLSFSPSVSVAEPAPTSLDHLVFCLGGAAKIWNHRREYIKLWWLPNTTRGFVWLDDHPPPPPPPPSQPNSTYPPYRVSARTSLIQMHSDRIARILKETFELGLPNVRWFVMGDDDTIFFMENLVSVLSKYDHRQMYYIGGHSEGSLPNMIHGFHMAFGGGGFAVSYALASELVQVLDGCILRYHHYWGSDEKVGACVAELGVPLTRELGFHQLDITGDPYGFLAAHPVAPLVSLHHLDVVHPFFPGQTQVDSIRKLMQAYDADPGLTVQQSFCYNRKQSWSLSLSWGYTAQLYPFLVSSKELGMALETFRPWHNKKPFMFNTRPLKGNPCQRPVIYFLDQVQGATNQNETTMTVYKKGIEAATGRKCNQTAYMNAMTVEQITVTAQKTDPRIWTKAPRRRCCEVMDGLAKKGEIRLMLRDCKPMEATNI